MTTSSELRTDIRRIGLIIAAVAAVLTVLFTPQFVQAQGRGPETESRRPGHGPDREFLAAALGITVDELNAAYAAEKDGKLYLMITGNIEDNFNKLEIFLDTAGGGNSILSTAGNDGSAVMNGLVFDAGFAPEYHLIVRRGTAGTGKFDLDFADLTSGEFAFYERVFGDAAEGRATTGNPDNSTFAVNPGSIALAYDGSNVAGVGGTAGAAADQVAAAAVTTGLELCIDLVDMGAPSDFLKVMVFQNNGAHDFASNQFLGGLPEGSGNLGAPSGLDLNGLVGDQFFTVPLPPELLFFTDIEPNLAGNETVITWTSTPGSEFKIESSTDLVMWAELEDSIPASDGETTSYPASTDFATVGRVYFRVTRQPLN